MLRFSFALLLIVGLFTSTGRAEFATQVISYTPGDVDASLQNQDNALGMPVGDTTYRMLTPFNPAWHTSHIMGIGG